MMSSRSISGITSHTALSGVAGLSATPALAAELANTSQLPVQVRRRLGVNRQTARAGGGEIVEVFLRLARP